MQHQVPVFYPETAGAAEFLKSGMKINPENTTDIAQKVHSVLEDRETWENIVQDQVDEIRSYQAANHETILLDVWDRLVPSTQHEIVS